LAFEYFQRCEVIDVRNLRLFEGGDIILGPLFWRDIVWFIQCKDAKRGLILDKLLIDFVYRPIEDLEMPLRSGAQTVISDLLT